MDTDEMLKWLCQNCDHERMGSGTYSDLMTYAEIACANGADYDTTRLQPESQDRIRMVFKQYGV